MSKPSSAELDGKFMGPQVLFRDQVDHGHDPIDGHDSLNQALPGHDDNGGAGSGLRLGQPDGLMSPTSSTYFNLPLDTPSAISETSSIYSLPWTSLLSSSLSSSSQPSPSLLPSLSISSSDDFSWNDGHSAVTKREVDWKDEDDDSPEGMVPEGTADVDKKIKAQSTWTILGDRIIDRAIDTCLEKGWTGGDGTPPPNRTFANEFVVVKKSPLQGYGIFAAVDIKKETHILLEKPFFSIKSFKQLKCEYARLNGEKKAVFDGLVGYDRVHRHPVSKKYNANNFEAAYGRRVILAIASNFNHACHSMRNTQYAWDDRRQIMTFTAMEDIKKDQEILISYDNRRKELYAMYGFICHCGGCENMPYR